MPKRPHTLLATLLAGATAGGAFRLLNPEDVGPARLKRAAPARAQTKLLDQGQ